MGRLRAGLARTRRLWLPFVALCVLVFGIEVVGQGWYDESTLANAWIEFALWAWTLALATSLAYESVRPVASTGARDRVWAGLIYGLAALPLLNLLAVVAYALLLPADQGISLEIDLGGFFVFLLLLVLVPALASTLLAGGLFLQASGRRSSTVLYWSAAAFVLVFPALNTLISPGFVYEQGGSLLVIGLLLVLAPVYLRMWKWRPRRAKPEPLYPA
jgi:hypothetical protein